ncbi:hypothetical protein C8R44DRAFT_878031 [Mycena epipterygia]|nr:hypothetical protein C8R44DRAFT_878031 [Mycena epipterygia]
MAEPVAPESDLAARCAVRSHSELKDLLRFNTNAKRDITQRIEKYYSRLDVEQDCVVLKALWALAVLRIDDIEKELRQFESPRDSGATTDSDRSDLSESESGLSREATAEAGESTGVPDSNELGEDVEDDPRESATPTRSNKRRKTEGASTRHPDEEDDDDNSQKDSSPTGEDG